MAVVRNLMVRIGADYSAAQKGMQGASKTLNRFKNDAERTTKTISGRQGLGGASSAVEKFGKDVSKTTNDIKGNRGLKGIGAAFAETGQVVSSAIERMRGAKGIGGIVQELGALKSASGSAGSGLAALGTRAAGAGTKVAMFAASLTAAVTVIGMAIMALHSFSQPAIQFESAIGRINMSLKQGSSEYLSWAKSMGIAKTSAAEMGSTYGVLLSSFIKDNAALTQSTKDLVQATRVVSSATGRTIEDTLERMRSGLLGNTEAIEDLGIFVNVSMIESTNAFKKFANGKSWDQLTFQVQQQIRLAAILEQTYSRYGTQLQNNVMTKQQALMEQLKNIKLHLSQAFMPIWESVLPALTRMAEGLSWLTEQIARFSYWVAGKDYDAETQGIDNQTGAIENQAGAYDDLAKEAKKARKELASFDRLNLLGSPSGGSSGGKSGGSSGGISTPKLPSGSDNSLEFPVIKPPPLIFPPPVPPDAGAGAVATAVTATVNSLNMAIKMSMADLWSNLQAQAQAGLSNQRLAWDGFTNNLAGVTLPKFVLNVGANWANMLNNLQANFANSRLTLQTGWSGMMDLLQNKLVITGSSILSNWGNVLVTMPARLATASLSLQTGWTNMLNLLKNNLVTTGSSLVSNWSQVLTTMTTKLATARTNINTAFESIRTKVSSLTKPLQSMSSVFSNSTGAATAVVAVFSSFAVASFGGVSRAISAITSPLTQLKDKFSSTLAYLKERVDLYLTPIVAAINAVKVAWNQLKTAFGGKPNADTQSGVSGEAVIAGTIAAGGTALAANWNKLIEGLQKSLKSLGKSISSGAGAVFGPIDAIMGNIYDKMSEEMGWGGSSLPAFASGGVVSAPTIAMVGDNHNARMNPEIITPQSLMYSTVQAAMGDSNAKVIALLERVARAAESGNNVQVTIAEETVGNASANYINRQYRRGVNILDAVT